MRMGFLRINRFSATVTVRAASFWGGVQSGFLIVCLCFGINAPRRPVFRPTHRVLDRGSWQVARPSWLQQSARPSEWLFTFMRYATCVHSVFVLYAYDS